MITPFIRAERSRLSDDFYLTIGARRDGWMAVAEEITYTKVDPGTTADPSIVLTKAEAQKLMNELWDAGLRQPGGTDGQLSATQDHLRDLQRLVFERARITANPQITVEV